jgi:hypothetical protein
MTENSRYSFMHDLPRFIEWREGFVIRGFCRYDDLRSLRSKILLLHWISISEGNFRQLWHLTKCLWQIGNDGIFGPALRPRRSALWRRSSTTLQTVVCGIPNCKDTRLVALNAFPENASWIRSTFSCEVLGVPAPVQCRTLPVSWNCFNQRRVALSEGGAFPYWVLLRTLYRETKVCALISLKQSPFWVMTS